MSDEDGTSWRRRLAGDSSTHHTSRKRRRDAGATKYASLHEFGEMYFADRIRYQHCRLKSFFDQARYAKVRRR